MLHLYCFLIFLSYLSAKMTYNAASYVPVVSTAMAAVLGVVKLSRQFGAYGIAGFLHRADIAKVIVVVGCLKSGRYTKKFIKLSLINIFVNILLCSCEF